MQAVAALVIAAAIPGINIDAQWLQQQGPGPYVLGQAGATYVLRADVTTSGPAFKITVSGVTFDLNGHTITYDNAQPITVANGGFEAGDFAGWDVSRAPDARVKPVGDAWWTIGWWGRYLAELDIPAGGRDTLATGPIAIPTAHIAYTASITPKGTTGTTVKVSVVDASTGAVLGSNTQNPATIGNGGTINVKFTPATTDPVKLVVDVTPPPGKPATLDLDYAAVARSGVHGIDLNWHRSDITITSTAPGGSIVQGNAGSTASYPINDAYGVARFVVTNLGIRAFGQDTFLIYVVGSSDVTIRGNALAASVNRVWNRQANLAFIQLTAPTTGSAGAYDISGNTMTGSHQNGIVVSGSNNFTSVRVDGNEIRQDSYWSNGYGISLQGCNKFEVADNTIIPVSGRGIMLQAVKGRDLRNGKVVRNRVETQERQNLEYAAGLNAIALRFRNYDGRISDVTISDNVFESRTGLPGHTQWATAVRFNVWNNWNGTTGQQRDCRVVFERNRVKAILVADDPAMKYQDAYALSLASFDPGSGIVFRDNILESNGASLQLGCNDGVNESDVTLAGNTLVKSRDGIPTIRSEDRKVRGYVGILAGLYASRISDIRLLDMKYAGGADGRVEFAGTEVKSVSFGNELRVIVSDAQGRPVPGARVTILDRDGHPVHAGSTDARGAIAGIPLITSTLSVPAGSGPNNSQVTTTAPGPFTARATSGLFSGTQKIPRDGARDVTIVVR